MFLNQSKEVLKKFNERKAAKEKRKAMDPSEFKENRIGYFDHDFNILR